MSIKVKTDLDLGSIARIVGLPEPTSSTEAATKAYVDTLIEGMKFKNSVRVATTTDLNVSTDLEAGDSIDGVVIVQNDRILVKDQSSASQNGIYIVQAAGAAVRSSDANSATELESAVVTVEEGVSNTQTTWRQTEVNFTLGSSDINFAPFGVSSPVASETVQGIAEIATLTEVDNGVDTSRYITPANLAASVHVPKRFTQDVGDASSTQFTVFHNFNTENIKVEIREAGGDKQVILGDWRITSVNSIRVDFLEAPSVNEYRVVIMA